MPLLAFETVCAKCNSPLFLFGDNDLLSVQLKKVYGEPHTEKCTAPDAEELNNVYV